MVSGNPTHSRSFITSECARLKDWPPRKPSLAISLSLWYVMDRGHVYMSVCECSCSGRHSVRVTADVMAQTSSYRIYIETR